ncbi:MAG: hypothetical protein AAFY69_05835 [Pseudomonadota bacterium]
MEANATPIKIGWTVFAVAVTALALSGGADSLGQEFAATALERAFLTWAVARGLNAVISVAQGTEVALEPGGVGVNLTVGEVLDPVNDLIERFSSVMLVATSAIGLQNVLLRITGNAGFSILLGLAAFAALLVIWVPSLAGRERLRAFVLRFLLITFLLRLAVPFLVIGSSLVFDHFLAAEQQAATAALRDTTTDIEEMTSDTPEANDPDRGMLQRFTDMVGNSLSSLNVKERLANLQERASMTTSHVVDLIVIFMLQTIALPLMFLWLLLEAGKALAKRATHW